ncbi:Small G protein signaling modulator 1, partial [Geodia barretti]
MEQREIQCEALINKCKQEAKQLAELAATKNKVHWSQSSFVSFCISVEEVLSYGVRKRYATSKQLSSSAKILADLGRRFPVAAATFDKCYGAKSHSSSSEDYAHLVTSSTTERRILWLRVAIIENSLVTIVNEIIKNAESVSHSLHLLSPFFFSLLFLLSLSSSPLLSTPHSFMFYMRQWLSVIASTATKSADQHSID